MNLLIAFAWTVCMNTTVPNPAVVGMLTNEQQTVIKNYSKEKCQYEAMIVYCRQFLLDFKYLPLECQELVK